MKKVVIFDFDGTIADTLPAFVILFNKLVPRFGHKHIEQKDIELLREKTSEEILHWLKIPLVKLPFFVRRVYADLNKEIDLLKPIEEIDTILAYLKQEDVTIGIVTSNSVNNVRKFLEANNLDCFDFVYSSGFLRKRRLLKKILLDRKILPGECAYIGDETRDIDAGKRIGVTTIAVSWGINSKERLEQQHPDYLVHTPNDLLTILRTLVS